MVLGILGRYISGREKAKRNKFLEGLNEELYSFVLAGSPASYAEAVDRAIDIEEGLQNRRSRVRPQVVQGNHPMVPVVQPSQSVQSSQPPQQQVAQQPGHQRFRPRGRLFKKKSGSSSSGSHDRILLVKTIGTSPITAAAGHGGSTVAHGGVGGGVR
ncbi:hypothetical protein F511_04855 [Dorcoceras hygrometricum]|uniref:Uncharacterized protein n=1 Tax=Dorcoceras hygrometricum TaxID=472368 RepID=A0A2Z7DIQ5_9LAMI|nr:hypothetical protein F511_04855 [Dorcoceras hygrometricum]